MWIPSYVEMYPHLQKSGQNECGYIPIYRLGTMADLAIMVRSSYKSILINI